jgi:uncharacterized protein YuzE
LRLPGGSGIYIRVSGKSVAGSSGVPIRRLAKLEGTKPARHAHLFLPALQITAIVSDLRPEHVEPRHIVALVAQPRLRTIQAYRSLDIASGDGDTIVALMSPELVREFIISGHARFEMEPRNLRGSSPTGPRVPGAALPDAQGSSRAPLEDAPGSARDDVSYTLEGGAVRITYDRHTDTLSLVLKEGAAVAESDEGRPGVILDYDAAGDLVSLEILDASRRVTEAGRVEYQTTG